MKLKNLLLLFCALTVSLAVNAQLTTNNAQRYYAEFKHYFVDDICTELKVPYSAMTDEQLRTAMSAMPEELVNIALKVKNNAWGKNEKEFRIAKFKPQTDPVEWDDYLNVYTYSLMPCPAGIIGNKENIMIFVGGEVPSGVSLGVYKVAGNDGHGFLYNSLRAGLNVISMPEDTEAKMLFIEYYAYTDTTETSKRLADYPEISMHFEGGHVNGYFDASKHDDAYWRELLAAHKADSVASSYPAIQVVGERVMFHMTRNEIAAVCPNTITDAIGWWDELVKFEHKLMGADKYYDRWNDRIMARNGVGSYMFATQGYTYYENSTLPEILSWEAVYSSPGRIWGPAHEIGHVNQGTINIVSCTEASNNLFSNAMIHNVGKTTTRGVGVATCREDYSNNTPFPVRSDVIGKSRMFFQLYLYFHAAGKDTTFYPRLFEALRHDRLNKGPQDNSWIFQTQAVEDQLKFAVKCCEIAQMDLSEFFEAWGFFVPMENTAIGDYSNYNVNLTKEEADSVRAIMQQYEKKGGHLMFIEDRIKPSKREDGVVGNRIDFNEEFAIGKMGSTGQWSDYIDESVKAQGYYYARTLNNITIKQAADAKGALGFKLYNAQTGELLDFNNEYKLTVPVAQANAPLRVVAAQADGTDAVVPDVAESDDEEMQLEALNATLSTVKGLTSKTTTTGKEIGHFYKSALTAITALYNEAKAAADNKDTSKHSYKEWIALLEKEMRALKNDLSARAYLKELDVYTLTNSENRSYGLCYDRYGLVGKTTQQMANTSPNKRWMFESTGVSHHYYIKNQNGLYINDIANIGTSCSGDSKEVALVFKANYLDDGTVYFTVQGSGKYLALDVNNYNIVASDELVKAATWGIRAVELNNTAVEEVEIEGENGDVKGEIYDLAGRRVENPAKGVYIVNGKKVFVK
ncbi:MAG: M60 family metallopeptidase [Bacteroidaceae bacterium]|nr:M60 family metallopeptidase [Bacteroidaceae bacterium]